MSNDRQNKNSHEKVAIEVDELIHLKRIEMLQNLEDNLENWAKKRFRTVLIVFTVLGFIGIQAIAYFVINQLLGSKIEEATIAAAVMKESANRIDEDAKTATDKAREAFELAEKQRLKVSETLTELNNQAIQLSHQLQKIQERAIGVSENVRESTSLDIKGLEHQIDILTSELETVRSKVGLTPKVEAEQKILRKSISAEKKEFNKNSQYEIDVIYLKAREADAIKVINVMRSLGFRVNDFGGSSFLEIKMKIVANLKQQYGPNIVEGENTAVTEYVKQYFAEKFPDWEIKATTELRRKYASEMVFSGLNIILW